MRAEKDRFERHLKPKAPPPLPKPTPEPAPPSLPREWKYIYVQVRGPRDGDAGVIADGQYGVSGNMVYLETMKGDPIGRQALQDGQDPAAIARQMLKAKQPKDFYTQPINRPTFH